MEQVRLGRTGLTVSRNGFGALPIQRISAGDASRILRKAFDHGITYFDTARFYTDSEEKLGAALSPVRDKIILATKTGASTTEGFWNDLHTSLHNLKTDYIDVYQFHNPSFLPLPGQENGLYEAMAEAKKQGEIRFIGITNHRRSIAEDAIACGKYDTLQFPFSYLADEKDIALAAACQKADIGFLAMKGLSGGLISNAKAAYAFLRQYENVLPLWGIQKETELDEFLSFADNPPVLDESLQKIIFRDQEELAGSFCRGCGYCLPCPAKIDIPTAARMSLLLRRAPVEVYTTPEMRENMGRIKDCIHCRHCAAHCPYGLDTPKLLEENYGDFIQFVERLDKN